MYKLILYTIFLVQIIHQIKAQTAYKEPYISDEPTLNTESEVLEQDILAQTTGRIWNLGANYHLQFNYIDIAPYMEIMLYGPISTGYGLNFLHYYRSGHMQGLSAYGGNLFLRYNPGNRIFLHGEYLVASSPYLNRLNYETYHVRAVSLLIGGGYRQAIGAKVNAYLFALYDLNHSEVSPYVNRLLVKAGVSF